MANRWQKCQVLDLSVASGSLLYGNYTLQQDRYGTRWNLWILVYLHDTLGHFHKHNRHIICSDSDYVLSCRKDYDRATLNFVQNVLVLIKCVYGFRICHNCGILDCFIWRWNFLTNLIGLILQNNYFLGRTSTLDVLIHGGNSAGMLLELWVTRHPVYIFHFIYTIGVGIIYLLFTFFYFLAGGLDPAGRHYIYHVIDWNNPGAALLNTGGIMVLGILLHIFSFIVHKLRFWLHKKYFQKEVFAINTSSKSSPPV